MSATKAVLHLLSAACVATFALNAAAQARPDYGTAINLAGAKKIAAGAEFIQTQCVFNVEKFELYMKLIRDRGLHEKVFILAGVTPLKSVGMAKYMKNRVPGMDVPDEIVKRMSGVAKEKQPDEGIQICVEAIQRLKQVEGVKGFHVMAIEWEERVPDIVERSGLYPRPQVP